MTDPLKFQRILQTLAAACATDLGAARAAALQPAPSAIAAGQRLDRTTEALALRLSGLAPVLCPRLDVGDLLAHATRGVVLEAAELAALGSLARCAGTTAAAARVHPGHPASSWPVAAGGLRLLAEALPDLGLLGGLLEDSVDAEGHILDTASPTLQRLRQEVVQLAARLRKRIGELVRETDELGLLQDEYYTLRDDRYVLPVKSSDKRVLGGIIHGSSNTGQTVYVEPREMVDGNNQLALAVEAVRREERRILTELTGLCADQADDLATAADGLADLDLALATALLAERLEAHRPQFDATLTLRRARHPVLVLDGVRVVANDVTLPPPARWLVVSGPNGGGKTVVLSTLGLAAEMARHGLYVCAADDATLPWFDAVLVVLGDAQDLERGLSTFEGHLRAVQRALAAAAPGATTAPRRALVLLDELAGGTEPIAGSALATAILEAFGRGGSMGAVTTHFEALKLLPLRDSAFENAALELDAHTLAPTYRLRLGQVGSSNPLALAARIGLDPAVVERAQQLVGGGGSEVAQMLARLEDMKRNLHDRLEEIEKQQLQLDRSRAMLDDQRHNEQRAVDRRVDRAAQDALGELAVAMRELDAARKAVAGGDRKAIDEATRTLTARQVQVQRLQAAAQGGLAGKPQREPLQVQEIVTDARAWHQGLGRVVTVLEADARSKRYRVRAGTLDVQCGLDDLRRLLPGEAAQGQRKPDRRPQPLAQQQETVTVEPGDTTADAMETLPLRAPEWTVDLRGQRVEEALEAVDQRLDQAVLRNARGICVVHGLGTGALREAVRQHLKRHGQVTRFRAGVRGEGGDGATLVWVKQ